MEDINQEILDNIKSEDYENLFKKVVFKRNTKYNSILNFPYTAKMDQIIPFQSTLDITKEAIEIIVIGAGGTGAYFIRDLSRFLYSIEKRSIGFQPNLSVTIYDGDVV